MKKHNFYAGPSILSQYTIKNTADAVLDFAGTGLSLLEISHRSKEFSAVMDEARALVKELLDVPAGYDVVYLGGGASLQFCMVPFNLLKKKAAYLETGTWAVNAIKEAKLFGEVDVVASSKEANFTYIPKNYTVPEDADYFHITTNNTIFGTEMRYDPDVKVPLVADMSSDIFSRRFQVRYHLCRRTKEPCPRRCYNCHCTRRRSRPCRKSYPHNARLPHPHQKRFDVQHASLSASIRSIANSQILQRTGWCKSARKNEHRKSRSSL